jgi:hypothetical protein
MAEVVVLTWCLYAVVNKVPIEEARVDLTERPFDVNINRFLSKYSWFTQLNQRIHEQDYNKRNHRRYEVDDLIVNYNPHTTEEEEDNDPNWFCLRKLKKALQETLLTSEGEGESEGKSEGQEDSRFPLLRWVNNFVKNCTENPIDYTILVPRQHYNLELDNHDIMLFSWIVGLCRREEEDTIEKLRLKERQRRLEFMATSLTMAEDI